MSQRRKRGRPAKKAKETETVTICEEVEVPVKKAAAKRGRPAGRKTTVKKTTTTTKRRAKRSNIPKSAVSELLKLGASDKRLSKPASLEVHKKLEGFLRDLAKTLNTYLNVSKTKTVTEDLIRQACEEIKGGYGLCDVSSILLKPTSRTRSYLSSPGLIRELKKQGLHEDARFSKDAKGKIVAVSEGYVKHWGKKAACAATGARRQTILARDIAAISCMY